MSNEQPGTPAPPPETIQVQLGEVAVNPSWQGHIVAISDNGGDLVMLTIHHPRHGPIRCLWSRTVAGGIAQWLNAALQAPILQHAPAPAPVAAAPEWEGAPIPDLKN
jgi:hypothetical protein